MASEKIINTPKEMKELYSKVFPNYFRFAIANTSTRVVYAGMKKSETWMRRNWDIRNKFLLGNGLGKGALRYNRAIPHRNINNIVASWGTPRSIGSKNFEFLEDQEKGFTAKGSTPLLKARTGKNYKKTIARKMKRNSKRVEDVRGVSKKFMAIHLRRLYKRGIGTPGSGKFFYLRDFQFSTFRAGLYQFKSNRIPTGFSKNGSRFQFPKIKRIFATGMSAKKKRTATLWMERSSKKIDKVDVERIFKIEADKAFNNQLKHRR